MVTFTGYTLFLFNGASFSLTHQDKTYWKQNLMLVALYTFLFSDETWSTLQTLITF